MSGLALSRVEQWLREAEQLSTPPQRIGTPVADEIHLACVDSRLAVSGSLFVAMPGERTDGHEFVDDAVSRGAVAVLVRHDRLPGVRSRLFGSAVVFPVDDTLESLQFIARKWREQFPALTRIGITGSNGKTTTKDIVSAILSNAAPTVFTHGNYNSDIGLPLELLRIREKHRYGVFELGMNRIGEISELTALLEPDVALITNVGSAHIGMIGSRRKIAEEKKSIFTHFDGRQTAVVPATGEFSRILSNEVNGTVVRHGKAAAGVREVVRDAGASTLVLNEGSVELPLPGAHMVDNALAAITVARVLEVEFSAIRAGIESLSPSFGRTQILQGRVTVIQDCYNANPESVGSALSLFLEMPAAARRIAVLGAMKELGSSAPSMHQAVVDQAIGLGVDELWLVGDEFARVSVPDDAKVKRFGSGSWAELDDAAGSVRDGDLILLKGSRSLELERLTPAFLAVRSLNG